MDVANNYPDWRFLTKRQAALKGLKPKKGIKPEEMWTNHHCCRTAEYYNIDDLEQMTDEEFAKFQQSVRDKRNEYQRERYWAKKEEKLAREQAIKQYAEDIIMGEIPTKTSWQWLANKRRIPIFKATAVLYAWESKEWYSEWYYYKKRETRIATKQEFEYLKNLYIEKFGGWSHIDLDNTTYDGKIWYKSYAFFSLKNNCPYYLTMTKQ